MLFSLPIACIDMHVLAECPRCSGDFSQCKQTKYNMTLPGLPASVVQKLLPADLTEAERAVAMQPGMYGRIWYGQGLAFDEAYQILQDFVCITHCSDSRQSCVSCVLHHHHPV